LVNAGGKTLGIAINAVSEVLRVSTDQIAPPPPMLSQSGNGVRHGPRQAGETIIHPF